MPLNRVPVKSRMRNEAMQDMKGPERSPKGEQSQLPVYHDSGFNQVQLCYLNNGLE